MASQIICDMIDSCGNHSVLGVMIFNPDPSPFKDTIKEKKMSKRIKKQLQKLLEVGGKIPLINVANGVILEDVESAVEKFFTRDYPEIALISVTDPRTGQIGAYLVPESWLSIAPRLVDPDTASTKLADVELTICYQLIKIKRERAT